MTVWMRIDRDLSYPADNHKKNKTIPANLKCKLNMLTFPPHPHRNSNRRRQILPPLWRNQPQLSEDVWAFDRVDAVVLAPIGSATSRRTGLKFRRWNRRPFAAESG